MSYAYIISARAARYIERLDRRMQARIEERVERIAADPRTAPNTKPLVNAACRWTSRVGDLRIIFRIDENDRLIVILIVGPRGQVYRDR